LSREALRKNGLLLGQRIEFFSDASEIHEDPEKECGGKISEDLRNKKAD
jgi:hypothetical protein